MNIYTRRLSTLSYFYTLLVVCSICLFFYFLNRYEDVNDYVFILFSVPFLVFIILLVEERGNVKNIYFSLDKAKVEIEKVNRFMFFYTVEKEFDLTEIIEFSNISKDKYLLVTLSDRLRLDFKNLFNSRGERLEVNKLKELFTANKNIDFDNHELNQALVDTDIKDIAYHPLFGKLLFILVFLTFMYIYYLYSKSALECNLKFDYSKGQCSYRNSILLYCSSFLAVCGFVTYFKKK